MLFRSRFPGQNFKIDLTRPDLRAKLRNKGIKVYKATQCLGQTMLLPVKCAPSFSRQSPSQLTLLPLLQDVPPCRSASLYSPSLRI